MNFLYFPIFLFGISLADPKILYLNKFFAGTTTYIANVEGYSALYLSSSDDIQLLKNITIDIGDSLTLDTLVNRKNADGSQKALTIGNVLSFTTTNSDAITQRLTGFIYVASAKQAADPDFSVYVIDGKYNITKSSSLSTTVILNTYYGLTPEYYAPDMNSYVDNIQQDKSAKIWLYSDIPFDNYTQKPAWGTFFYNPLVFDNIDENNNAYQTEQFFDNIEPLQISYDAWYILSNGKISLTIDKYWDNSLEDSTTSRTTTGLIINPPLGLFAKTKIYFQHDAHNNRTTGMYATSNVNSPVDVTFYSSQATLFAQFVGNKPIIGLQEWSPNDATSLFVNSSYLMPGQFSVQYFVIDGLSVYTLTSSSPSTVQTTTPKSSVTSTIQTTTTDPRTIDLYSESIYTRSFQVEVGSNLFLSSNDKATFLSKITLTNGNTVKLANTLLSQFNSDGSMLGWTMTDSTLTITTTNDNNTIVSLTGFIYITTASQANDANFQVFKVQSNDQPLNIKKSSTAVFLTVQPTRNDSAPSYQPFRNILFTNFVQQNTTNLRIYNEIPKEYYKNDTATMNQLIFRNPIDLTPLNDTRSYVFFDNVEPIQFPLRFMYLTVDGDVSFTVSNSWQDQIIYNTTAVTTTGIITNHLFEVNTTVNFQINPNNNRTVGLIAFCDDLWAGLNYTYSSSTSQSTISFSKGSSINNVLFTTNLAATQLYGVPLSNSVGIFYMQYFGIDGIPLSSTSAPSTISTTQSPPTTPTISPTTSLVTKSTFSSILMFLSLLFLWN